MPPDELTVWQGYRRDVDAECGSGCGSSCRCLSAGEFIGIQACFRCAICRRGGFANWREAVSIFVAAASLGFWLGVVWYNCARTCESVDGPLVSVSIISKHFDQAPYEAVMRVFRQTVKMGFKFLADAVCDRYPCHIVFTGVRPPR
jgi:hypothetical protein